mmetsp:Transcript_20799/g.65395  ORF Transcript_20799/g.65395 Transcript_20799/m.65395 type:complete len:120 (-) Transcript_20799:202-561(-)
MPDPWTRSKSSTDESAFSQPKGLSREEAVAIVPPSRVKTLTDKWETGSIETTREPKIEYTYNRVDLTGSYGDGGRVDLTGSYGDGGPGHGGSHRGQDAKKSEVIVPPEDDFTYGCFCLN